MQNLEKFKAEILYNHISEFYLFIDENPQFQISKIPFDFKYCEKIVIKTANKYYKIFTSQSETGNDYLWIEKIECNNINKNYDEIIINSKITKLIYEISEEYNPNKIQFDFENNLSFTIFAGEIYDDYSNIPKYVLNDEMILLFEKASEVQKFEKLITK